MDNSVACASAMATGVVAPCTTGVGDVVACGTMAAAGVAPCGTTAADAGALPAAGVPGVASALSVAKATAVGAAPLSDVVSTWRSTISAALRSGVEDADGESDPDANEASRNRPEFSNACLMSLPVRP